MNGATIEFLYRGRVAPLTKMRLAKDGQRGQFDGGAYYSSGEICGLSRQIKNGYENIPTAFPVSSTERVSGLHLFGGMLQNEHFGHFIAESLSRIWAFQCLDKSFDSVAFFLRRPDQPIAKFCFDAFSLIIPNLKIKIVNKLSEFDLLAVPQQIAHADNGFIYGHPMIRNVLRPIREITAAGSKRIYVSRSRLSPREGGVLLETVIEKNLEAEGYEIVHPQELSLTEQIAKYNGAKHLIFADGSALHLYALVAKPDQKVFVIWRRKINGVFAWQISTFGGPKVEGQTCVSELWIPERDGTETVHAKAVLDHDLLLSQLKDGGFVAGRNWEKPDTAAFQEDLKSVSSRLNQQYRPRPLLSPSA